MTANEPYAMSTKVLTVILQEELEIARVFQVSSMPAAIEIRNGALYGRVIYGSSSIYGALKRAPELSMARLD